MDSTLAIAKRAVEADTRGSFAEALALYLQAATELEAFALAASKDGSRTAEEVQGAWAE